MRPMFGMNPVLLDDKANELMGNDQSGALCLKTPWPGMARTVVGDHERLSSSHVFANFLNMNLRIFSMKYYLPYESPILSQLLNLISLDKANFFEPRFESYDPWDMAK